MDSLINELKDLPACPSAYQHVGDRLNDVFDPGIRHKSGSKPTDYLKTWLSMLRPFAYATKDDSWGELEKLLCIIMSNYVRALRLAPRAANELERLSSVVGEQRALLVELMATPLGSVPPRDTLVKAGKTIDDASPKEKPHVGE